MGLRFLWQDVELFAAAGGEDAIRLLASRNPDLAILDLALSGGGGFQLLKEIRRLSLLPLVLLSRSESQEDEVRGLELGADACVARPFGSLAFLARVKAVLRRAEALPPPATPPRLRKRIASGDRGR